VEKRNTDKCANSFSISGRIMVENKHHICAT